MRGWGSSPFNFPDLDNTYLTMKKISDPVKSPTYANITKTSERQEEESNGPFLRKEENFYSSPPSGKPRLCNLPCPRNNDTGYLTPIKKYSDKSDCLKSRTYLNIGATGGEENQYETIPEPVATTMAEPTSPLPPLVPDFPNYLKGNTPSTIVENKFYTKAPVKTNSIFAKFVTKCLRKKSRTPISVHPTEEKKFITRPFPEQHHPQQQKLCRRLSLSRSLQPRRLFKFSRINSNLTLHRASDHL